MIALLHIHRVLAILMEPQFNSEKTVRELFIGLLGGTGIYLFYRTRMGVE